MPAILSLKTHFNASRYTLPRPPDLRLINLKPAAAAVAGLVQCADRAPTGCSRSCRLASGGRRVHQDRGELAVRARPVASHRVHADYWPRIP